MTVIPEDIDYLLPVAVLHH